MKKILSYILICVSCLAISTQSIAADACTDPQYLELKSKNVGDLTNNELDLLKTFTESCASKDGWNPPWNSKGPDWYENNKTAVIIGMLFVGLFVVPGLFM